MHAAPRHAVHGDGVEFVVEHELAHGIAVLREPQKGFYCSTQAVSQRGSTIAPGSVSIKPQVKQHRWNTNTRSPASFFPSSVVHALHTWGQMVRGA